MPGCRAPTAGVQRDVDRRKTKSGGIQRAMVRLVVDNRVRIVEGLKLDEDLLSELKRPFVRANPEFGMKSRLGISTWGLSREYITWKAEGADLTFPRGGIGRVTQVLRDCGEDVDVFDGRQYGSEYDAPAHRVNAYPFQHDIIEAALDMEQCLFRAPTGSGKTSVLIGIASRVRVPTLIIVHSQALLNQWTDRIVAELGLKRSQVGVVQGSKFNLRPITVTIQKTMARVAEESKEVRDYFGCIIADEVHLFAASTFFACVDPFPARYRIGASADHRRKDRKEFLIHDLFGDVAKEVTRNELIKSGHILDVEIRVVPTDFVAPWYGLADEEDKNDTREIDFTRLVKEMVDDPERNFSVATWVRAEIARGEQVLVMAHEREHCMKLGQLLLGMGIKTGYLLGGAESSKEFEASLKGLKSGELRVGVGTYSAIGTGIDLPRIGAIIAVTPVSGNEQNFGQIRGRACRIAEGKKNARLYVLWDQHVYPNHLKNLIRWNKVVLVRDPGSLVDWTDARHYLKSNGT